MSAIKILIVDDYPHSCLLLSRLLEKSSFEFAIARNGKEAVEMATEKNFSVILMDLDMPVMDGFEAIKAIRQLAGYERMPIIAMSPRAMSGDLSRSIDVGATDYVGKPIDGENLIETIRFYLEHLKTGPDG